MEVFHPWKFFIKGLTSPFPSCTHTSTRFLFTYNKNVGVSSDVFAFFKTLGLRFTMEAFQQGSRFPVSKLPRFLFTMRRSQKQYDSDLEPGLRLNAADGRPSVSACRSSKPVHGPSDRPLVLAKVFK
jgi:hypothetical protein